MEKQSIARTLVLLNIANLALLTVLLVLGIKTESVLAVMTLTTLSIAVFTIIRFNGAIAQIDKIARQISRGDRKERIPDLDVQEFDAVGKSLNRMIGSMDSTIGHLALHREELRLIISSIEDVLWSQNSAGIIQWANDSFARLFGGLDAEGKRYYWELIRDPALCEFIVEVSQQSHRLIKEFVLDGHYYLVIASSNPEADRIIFSVQNIDPIRQAEQMKKDFVVNLAHELRTPLTAIKGFSEALAETATGDDARYVGIIRNHTLRLIRLISDLEDLIRLENAAPLALQQIDTAAFFANLRMLLQPLVQEKGLTLDIEGLDACPQLWADPFKLEQVFINLVENSVRYTETGGIRINIRDGGPLVTIDVADTGAGIAEQHLKRIFERFYVADPSRNRGKSGTGLGLAIVKHIIQMHHGSISVSSQPGMGCTFHIMLPAHDRQ